MNLGTVIRQQAKLFSKLAKKTELSQEAKLVHSLRVTTRKLRTILWVGEESSPPIQSGKIGKRLKKLGRVLGAHRRLDVAGAEAHLFGVHVSKIKTRKRRAGKEVASVLAGKRRNKIFEGLLDVSGEMEGLPSTAISRPLSILAARLQQASLQPPKTKKDRHELRILVKKVRYVLSALGENVPELQKLQDCLGRERDLEELDRLSGGSRQVALEFTKSRKAVQKVLLPTLNTAIDRLTDILENLPARKREKPLMH